MKFSGRLSAVAIVSLIMIGALIGGVLGNWLFIYLVDRYYDISGGNYLSSAFAPHTITRSPEKQEIINTSLREAVTAADQSLVGIFKRSSLYLPTAKVGQALIITSDGWLMTTMPATTFEKQSDYVIAVSDKKIYEIDRVVEALPSVTFIHISNANNLPVQDLVPVSNLSFGEMIVAVDWQTNLDQGIIAGRQTTLRSSETVLVEIPVGEVEQEDGFLFNNMGRVVGFRQAGTSYGIEVVHTLLTKLLLMDEISFPRLGVNYVNTEVLSVETVPGALLVSNGNQPAVIPGSPAAKGGLQEGDIITMLADIPIESGVDITSLIMRYNPGQTLPLTVMRGKESRRFLITLDEQSH